MTTPAQDIATLLAAQSIGTAGIDLFVGRDAGGLTQSISIYDVGGPAPNPVYVRDAYDIQISVWGAVNDYSGGYSKSVAIKNYLLGLADTTVGNNIYFAFNMRSNLAFMKYDSNNRPEFMMLFRIYVDSNVNTGNRTAL